MAEADIRPLLLPLGERGLLIRFSTTLTDAANRAAIAFSRRLDTAWPEGVVETDPKLVSVLLRYDPARTSFERLAGEVRLLLGEGAATPDVMEVEHRINVRFGGGTGPDLEEVAAALGRSPDDFIAAHNAAPLRVLTTGFAPGFVYCGFHPETLKLPRRTAVRPPVPVGSILFAAGQTAIAATPIPTGWHVIGVTDFRNFDPAASPPTKLAAGDTVRFEAVR